MSDVLAEIDEVMRRERMQKIWDDYGSLIIGGILAVLIFTAGWSYYRHWDQGVKEAQTSILLSMLEEEEFPASLDPSDPDALKMRPDLKALTYLMAAGRSLENDKPEEALSFYQAALGTKSARVDYKDLAGVMMVRLSKEMSDEAKLAALTPIFKNEKSPWRYHAALDLAAFHVHSKGDYAAAKDYLNVVIQAGDEASGESSLSFLDGRGTQNMPQTLLQRARILSHVYDVEKNLKAQENKGS